MGMLSQQLANREIERKLYKTWIEGRNQGV